MSKFIIAILSFGIASCGNQKTELGKINQLIPPTDSAMEQTAVPTTVENTATFAANAVTTMGKAINCIFQDVNNNYWFASNGEGAYRYDGKTLLQFTTKDALCDNQVFTIQEDKQGNIWLLTVGGVSRFDGKKFTTFPNKDRKQIPDANDGKIEQNDLWFETAGGAYRYNSTSFSYLLLPKPSAYTKSLNATDPQNPDARKVTPYTVYCSMQDKKGNLWLGTQTLGVCCYDGKTFTWLTEKGLGGPAVRALFEDKNGNFWFGNNGNGLFRYDGKTLTNFTEEKGLGNPAFLKTGKPGLATLARVWSVNEDNIGNLWIGTYDAGVWRYDGQNLVQYTTKDGLASNIINTIYKDKKGDLWFGTDGAGVSTFNGTSFVPFR